MVLAWHTKPVAFPRSLAIVRGQADIAHSLAAQTTSEPGPYVRESSALLNAIARSTGYRVDRNTALQVPALVNALKTYSHTISAFGLREYRNDDPIAARPFLNCPCKTLPYSSIMQRTIEDILLYDRAYWRVTERSWDNFPSSIEFMPVDDVNDNSSEYAGTDENALPPSDPFYFKGQRVAVRDVIKFYGDGLGGWLKVGAQAIHTAAALQAAAVRNADYPLPTLALKNTGADLPEQQVDRLLDAWEEARANRATAYLNSTIEIEAMGYSARDQQLVDALAFSALQMARLANLDPIWTGAGVPGSSLTYSSRVDLYRQLLDTALTPIMNMVAQRLSMTDVTPRGHSVRFDTTEFLRANPQDLTNIIKELVPMGIIDIEEARQLLDLPTLGVMSFTRLPMEGNL
jgi:HK97 family phage portal protein